MALLMKKFKKFTRSNKKFYKGETSRRPYKKDKDEEDEKKKEDQALCYNCRKPGYFKVNCPYPTVKKYTDEEKRAWKERKDKELRKGRKAMKTSDHEDEGKKKKEESSSDESCSSSSSSSEEALLCLMAQEEKEDEVTSRINSSNFSSTSPHCEQDLQTMFQELLTRFEEIQASHETLIKENESLKSDKERLRKELDKVTPVFDKVVGNSGKAGLGFKGEVGQPSNEAKEASNKRKINFIPSSKAIARSTIANKAGLSSKAAPKKNSRPKSKAFPKQAPRQKRSSRKGEGRLFPSDSDWNMAYMPKR
ncbi:hypothetical protein Dimus_038557 [Dionaea muscipula]